MSSRMMDLQPLPTGLQALQEGTKCFKALELVLPADHHQVLPMQMLHVQVMITHTTI